MELFLFFCFLIRLSSTKQLICFHTKQIWSPPVKHLVHSCGQRASDPKMLFFGGAYPGSPNPASMGGQVILKQVSTLPLNQLSKKGNTDTHLTKECVLFKDKQLFITNAKVHK